MATQYRIGKDSKGKVRLDKESVVEKASNQYLQAYRLYINGAVESSVQELKKVQGINTNNINTNISILSNQQQEEVDETRKS